MRRPEPALIGWLCVLVVLASCGMDAAKRHYLSYRAYAEDGALADAMMASPVMPESAASIAMDVDFDRHEAILDFEFNPKDLGLVVNGFQAISKPEHDRLVREPWMKLPDPDAIVMRRCSKERVEFLAVGADYHVHYQSTPFPAMLGKFCSG